MACMVDVSPPGLSHRVLKTPATNARRCFTRSFRRQRPVDAFPDHLAISDQRVSTATSSALTFGDFAVYAHEANSSCRPTLHLYARARVLFRQRRTPASPIHASRNSGKLGIGQKEATRSVTEAESGQHKYLKIYTKMKLE